MCESSRFVAYERIVVAMSPCGMFSFSSQGNDESKEARDGPPVACKRGLESIRFVQRLALVVHMKSPNANFM